MWYLFVILFVVFFLNKSLVYLMLGLMVFFGWKQSIFDVLVLLVIVLIVIGWFVVEWLCNKNNKYIYLVEGLCVVIVVVLVLYVISGFYNLKVLDVVVVGL